MVAELSGALAAELSRPAPKPARPSADCDLLLIDVAHLFWAAWHASADQEVGAAFSTTIDKLHGVLQDVPHKHAAVCIDWPPYWRVEVCSEYKAQRARPSEFAVAQFKRIRDRIAADGHVVWGKKGFEADDVIATAVRLGIERAWRVTVASGDKDLMQLVCDSVVVYDTRSGEVYGPEEVRAKYGVLPDKVRDLLTLTGDTSDNVPGVRGIGPKKASALLEVYGNWRAAVDSAKSEETAISPAIAKALREHDDFELAWTLVGLRDDVPIDFSAFDPAPCVTVEAPKELEKERVSVSQPRKETPIMATSKFSLENINGGRKQEPFDIILYGPEGTGKSTFASNAPSPVFFDLEGGTGELDVKRMPQVDNWAEFGQGMEFLAKERHPFKTVVVDTADALEILIHRAVCAEHKEESIEAFGYGKGYEYALKLWQEFVGQMRTLRARGMHTIVLAHSQVRTFSNPRGADYDRFQLKLGKKADGLLKDRAKAVLFVTYDDAVKEKKIGKSKAFGDGSRVVFTEYRPAFDAKNRYGLPFEMSLNWDEFEVAARAGQPASLEEIREELTVLLPTLSEELRTKAEEGIKRANDDTHKLAQLVDWCRSKVAA